MFRIMLTAMLLIQCASTAAAQSDYHKFEFFGGYSHNRIDRGIESDDPSLQDLVGAREGSHGVNISATRNFARHFGVKFDFSAHFNDRTFPIATIPNALELDSRIYSFLGGIQVKDNASESTFKPFAHALAGAAYSQSRAKFTVEFCAALVPSPCPENFKQTATGFAGAFGGGMDVRVSNRVDIRVFQFDYNPTITGDRTQHHFRIGVGIVFH